MLHTRHGGCPGCMLQGHSGSPTTVGQSNGIMVRSHIHWEPEETNHARRRAQKSKVYFLTSSYETSSRGHLNRNKTGLLHLESLAWLSSFQLTHSSIAGVETSRALIKNSGWPGFRAKINPVSCFSASGHKEANSV